MLKTRDSKLTVITVFYAMCLMVANIIAVKIVGIAGATFSAAVVAFVFAFIALDVVTDVYGKKVAHELIVCGFAVSVFCVLLVRIAIILPPAGFWGGQEAFADTLTANARITVASLTTFFLSKMVNVYIFDKIKTQTGDKWLWLRNNVSSIIAQFVDTAIFITAAFIGVFEIRYMLGLVVAQWLVKVGLDVIKTPVVYLGVWFCKRGG